jgi:hypothetical protein
MKIHRLLLLCLFLLACVKLQAQTFSVSGTIYSSSDKQPLPGATIGLLITQKDNNKKDQPAGGAVTDENGRFKISGIAAGRYKLQVSFMGYEAYKKTIGLVADLNLGKISLQPAPNALNEVKVVQKILAVVQKDDTTEFNAAAYKTNPDADATDLVKKMPGIELNGKGVKAQGENVVKIMVDGKPFFGNDPYAVLSNLPAEVIDKVQVYNEKSDQEQFTGFNEGPTIKTINIVTKKDKRHGIFGKLAAGIGGTEEQTDKYTVGGTVNKFNGDKRLSITAQTNNINQQNFTDGSAPGIPPASGAGVNTIRSTGINYSDKWGKKTDVSGSYFFNSAHNNISRDTRREYILAADSGQLYNESSGNITDNFSHRFSLRLNTNFDSMNSLMFQPQLSLQRNYNTNGRSANTTQADTLLNATDNTTGSNALAYNFSANAMFRHRFRKKSRTFSANLNAGNSHNNGTRNLGSKNTFYTNHALDDTLNQQTLSEQNNWSIGANLVYTEPVGKNGLAQLQYNLSDAPGNSSTSVFNAGPAGIYNIPNDSLSNTVNSTTIHHKAGGSYQYKWARCNISMGLYYQYTYLYNKQQQPYLLRIEQSFSNLLPVASFQYRFSNRQNLHVNYTAATSAPGVGQLQNVINNSNPLQLSTGNPGLKQSFRHDLTIRFISTNTDRKTNLSCMVNGDIVQNAITNNSFIATHDSLIRQGIILPQGAQLSMPVNINGQWSLRGNINYGLPLAFLKCNLGLGLSAGILHTPGIINNSTNYDDKRSAGISATLSSNISEGIDFILSSNTNISNDLSTLTGLTTDYINQALALKFNWLTKSGFVLNTEVNYQSNSGNAAGFNQNFTVWNISIGQKLFKRKLGDIRFTVYDILNQNNSIQHTVTETYISDVRSTILQRYFMLTFTYKIREFK